MDIHLRDISWKPDGSYALIVGYKGTVLKYDGTNIIKLNSGSTENFHGISWRPGGSEAIIVGDKGLILVFDGDTFTRVNSGTEKRLYDVDWRHDGKYALIIGSEGTVLMYTPLTTDQKPLFYIPRELYSTINNDISVENRLFISIYNEVVEEYLIAPTDESFPLMIIFYINSEERIVYTYHDDNGNQKVTKNYQMRTKLLIKDAHGNPLKGAKVYLAPWEFSNFENMMQYFSNFISCAETFTEEEIGQALGEFVVKELFLYVIFKIYIPQSPINKEILGSIENVNGLILPFEILKILDEPIQNYVRCVKGKRYELVGETDDNGCVYHWFDVNEELKYFPYTIGINLEHDKTIYDIENLISNPNTYSSYEVTGSLLFSPSKIIEIQHMPEIVIGSFKELNKISDEALNIELFLKEILQHIHVFHKHSYRSLGITEESVDILIRILSPNEFSTFTNIPDEYESFNPTIENYENKIVIREDEEIYSGDDKGLVSFYYDEANDRYIYLIAGLGEKGLSNAIEAFTNGMLNTVILEEGNIGTSVILQKVDVTGEIMECKYEIYNPKISINLISVENNKIKLIIDSDLKSGTTILVTINKDVLSIDTLSQLKIYLDNEEIRPASNYEDVFEPSEDAKYVLVLGNEKTEALIYIPSFSEHTIEIIKKETKKGTPGFEMVALIVALGAVMLVKRRRK